MKKTLLILFAALTTLAAQAQTFEWGTATWNIQDGRVYESIQEYEADPVALKFSNSNNYTLTFFHIISVKYDIFVDDATEPIHAGALAQGDTNVLFDYDFPEGHDFRIVTTSNELVQLNLATYTTDTLSLNSDSYTISFRINGPEIVQTYNYEATMSLAIVDQEWWLTFSEVDTEALCKDLGINDITEAQLLGLNANGSYNRAFLSDKYGYDIYDGWRDADEGFTFWFNYDNQERRNLLGHQPWPAVYCMKMNETCDTIKYYYYDDWKEYNPDDPGEVPVINDNSNVKQKALRRAPETHYNSIIWDWENEDGTITQYTRSYRCEEGQDYSASWIFKADKKAVKINATMHFVSQEAYAEYLAHVEEMKAQSSTAKPVAYYDLTGRRLNAPRRGFNIAKLSNGKAIKFYK